MAGGTSRGGITDSEHRYDYMSAWKALALFTNSLDSCFADGTDEVNVKTGSNVHHSPRAPVHANISAEPVISAVGQILMWPLSACTSLSESWTRANEVMRWCYREMLRRRPLIRSDQDSCYLGLAGASEQTLPFAGLHGTSAKPSSPTIVVSDKVTIPRHAFFISVDVLTVLLCRYDAPQSAQHRLPPEILTNVEAHAQDPKFSSRGDQAGVEQGSWASRTRSTRRSTSCAFARCQCSRSAVAQKVTLVSQYYKEALACLDLPEHSQYWSIAKQVCSFECSGVQGVPHLTLDPPAGKQSPQPLSNQGPSAQPPAFASWSKCQTYVGMHAVRQARQVRVGLWLRGCTPIGTCHSLWQPATRLGGSLRCSGREGRLRLPTPLSLGAQRGFT